MNRKLPYDQMLIFVVLLLLSFGLLMVFSASPIISRDLYGNVTGVFWRQLIAAAVGMFLFLSLMRIDHRIYAKSWIAWGVAAASAGLLIIPQLMTSGPAARWIRIGPAQFQPSEAAKIAAIVFIAYHLSGRKNDLASFSKDILPPLLVVGGLVGLVLLGSDLGTAACIAAVAGILLYLGGLRYRHAFVLLIAGSAALAALIVTQPYRQDRIRTFLTGQEDPLGADYQINQSLIAVGSGGVDGVGIAEGKQKLRFLPEAHTDFIFAIVGEELGFIGCIALLVLFVLFLWRGTVIALRADTAFGRTLGLGIVSMVILQALINMSVVVQLLPTKGIPLPFISVGGSSLMVTLAASGILLNISRHQQALKAVASPRRGWARSTS